MSNDAATFIFALPYVLYGIALGVAGLRQAWLNKRTSVGPLELVGMLWRGEIKRHV